MIRIKFSYLSSLKQPDDHRWTFKKSLPAIRRTIPSMPARLLPQLTSHPQTGEQLGAHFGVGRVTISNWAHKLQDQGVPIQISRAGYALPLGTPVPQFIPLSGQFGRQLRYFGTLESTQDEVRTWAAEAKHPAQNGATVVAERQTKGRGRRGRAWQTTHGTLAFSVLLGGPYTVADLSYLPLAAGVALQQATGIGGLKWPNDLLAADGRKLAGILLEADWRGDEVRQVVLGIGINVTDAPPGASCLSQWNPKVTRAGVLAATLQALEYWLTQPSKKILAAWRAASIILGAQIQVKTMQGQLKGKALDLDLLGNLLLETDQGVQTIHTGDVQMVGQFTTQQNQK